MKRKKWLVSLTMSLALILSACGKKASENSVLRTTRGSSTTEVTPIANHTTKAPDLGIAKSFSVMAYISIASSQGSSVIGKVGLKPGGRSLVGLSAGEVTGGAPEIYAGDDSGDAQGFLSMAREDLIAAYKEVVGRSTDKDKIDAYRGELGGKILPAGTYRFSGGATIPSDLTLEGTDSDVWIFQVEGDINLAANTRINLSGGAQAKNIFWQASGRVVMGSNSLAVGTFMNQLTAELKQGAQLNGRILCKNGKVLLTQTTITNPEK
jgi:hypothetical protein